MFAAGVATFGSLYCVQPLMPEFSRYFGVSAAESALSLSLTSGVLAVGLLLAGPLADAWGRKTLMSICLLASALMILASAAAPNWTSLLVLRTLLGVSLCGVPAVAMAYLAEEVDPESIGLAMGLYISGSAVGGMGGRLFAGVVADFFDWRTGLAGVGIMALVAALLFTRSLPPSRHFHARPFDLRGLPALTLGMFRDPGLPWLFAEGFLLLGAFVTVYNYIGYRLMAPPYRLSQTAVGLIFSVYLVGTLSSTGIGHLAGKLGRRKVLWAMFVVMLVGVALTAAAELWLIIAGIVVVTFGFFGGHSIVSSWVGRRAGAAKANAAALYLFAYYMGSSLAGALGGICYTVAGWRGVTMFVTVLWGTGLLIAWRLYYLRPLAELERPSRLLPSV
jgi:YNFM family putative membrane transporter